MILLENMKLESFQGTYKDFQEIRGDIELRQKCVEIDLRNSVFIDNVLGKNTHLINA